ncbi:hypothetical protein [Reyranella sp.]|jgi:hypothetical protein|uniref:hypothetical protein n=1 Tax=Reyranella sp. TaxID=1929291 RepID=UPI000BD69441|nr:hypothetical protein [Reyranella sp.]OYY39502.1 MAG: hypothetical protein B7Y57_19810 [Rhodospirillales bacterium 35-66-84]OYZ92932.1 MAG: hypothetical protein B7Y08_19175 [Rhodospirillales bacterium 24-66-33]OZB24371.1 MAG: hypothetical protein B7X63_15845 [Rhodospirillales bacterium 39-66-50]HQS14565.1 hypothetical protein [Reyranella sp.]HQT12521.1 hypothetical protein [Reyranella sp.]
MLTEDEMKRIAAEERYRHSIRKSLEEESASPAAEPPPPPPPPGFGAKLYEFLNSSVGMWLLSSVVLTGGAAFLQQVQHQHEISLKNQADLTSHRFEIEHRLDGMSFLLRRAVTVGDAKAALGGVFKSAIPVTPELQNRSLASLYLSVYPLLAGTEKEKTNRAYNLVKELEDIELVLQPLPDNKPLDDAQRTQIAKLMTAIQQLKFDDGR